MKPKLSILILLLLIPTFYTLGQSLPKIIVIKGDTSVLISPEQLLWANKKIATVNYLEKKTITLTENNKAYANNLRLQIMQAFQYQEQIKAYQNKEAAYKKAIQNQKQAAKSERKKARKRKTRAVVSSFGVGIIVGLIASIFI